MAIPDSVIRSARLDLVLLSAPVLDALLSGQRDVAQTMVAFSFPLDFPEEHDLEFLRFRRSQLQSSPSWAPWLARAIVRRSDMAMVGTATFHGPPGINDLAASNAAEVGYTIGAQYRNHGYATEAARAMIDWAHNEHGVRYFVSATTPDNAPSLRVIQKLGFEPTGVVDDGELIFQLHLSGGR
jgi:[ribosomal protein S5]-alanine N-acetyltransferase